MEAAVGCLFEAEAPKIDAGLEEDAEAPNKGAEGAVDEAIDGAPNGEAVVKVEAPDPKAERAPLPNVVADPPPKGEAVAAVVLAENPPNAGAAVEDAAGAPNAEAAVEDAAGAPNILGVDDAAGLAAEPKVDGAVAAEPKVVGAVEPKVEGAVAADPKDGAVVAVPKVDAGAAGTDPKANAFPFAAEGAFVDATGVLAAENEKPPGLTSDAVDFTAPMADVEANADVEENENPPADGIGPDPNIDVFDEGGAAVEAAAAAAV